MLVKLNAGMGRREERCTECVRDLDELNLVNLVIELGFRLESKLPKAPAASKMMQDSKVDKINSKIIILCYTPNSMRHSVEDQKSWCVSIFWFNSPLSGVDLNGHV